MATVQIRNVPEEARRKLKARAALEGKSLSEYALGELLRSLQRPTMAELLERVRSFDPADVDESGAESVRAERDAR